jgi:glycosyltransferase involved in cell wall biosynthesis
MHNLTAIITCKNEEHGIEAALKSVSWCNETIVVDSYSTDKTVEIAKKYTDRLLQHEYISAAAQKNWAIPQAAYEWILIVDADERVTPELKEEIKTLLSYPEIQFNAYWIYRRNFFMGKEIKFSGWQHDKVVRLFKRDLFRYEGKLVHEEIIINDKTGKLKNRLLHYTYKDIFHYLAKWDSYSTSSALDAAKKNVNPGFIHFIIKPAFRFCNHYFFKLGLLDGYAGFIISSLAAKGVFMRYVKLREINRKNVKHI